MRKNVRIRIILSLLIYVNLLSSNYKNRCIIPKAKNTSYILCTLFPSLSIANIKTVRHISLLPHILNYGIDFSRKNGIMYVYNSVIMASINLLKGL